MKRQRQNQKERKNKSKKKADLEGKKNHTQKSYSIRASLHKDTFYGKLKNPEMHLDKYGNPLISKPIAYVTQNGNEIWNFSEIKDLESIYDNDLKEIVRRKIEWFNKNKIQITKEAYEKYPLYRYSPSEYPEKEPENPISKKGNPLPLVKKIRTLIKNSNSIIGLKDNKYADSDGNYIIALYELKKKKGKPERDFIVLSTFKAIQIKNKKEALFPDEKVNNEDHILPILNECPFLKRGDSVIIYKDDIDKQNINWEDQSDLKMRLYYITELGNNPTGAGYAVIKLTKHNRRKKASDKYASEGDFLKKSETIKAIKVRLDILGRIISD